MTENGELVAERTDEPLSKDTIFSTLSSRRRRLVLHYLKQNPGPASIRDLSEQIAAWENDVSVAELTYKQRKRVYTSLHQTHLPKLDDTGVVEYDRDRGTVVLTERAATLDIYLEVVPENDIPWCNFYLGLAAISAVALVCAWLDLFPFSLLPGFGYAVVVTLALGVSSVAHTYYTRRNRLGGAETPADSTGD